MTILFFLTVLRRGTAVGEFRGAGSPTPGVWANQHGNLAVGGTFRGSPRRAAIPRSLQPWRGKVSLPVLHHGNPNRWCGAV